MTRKLTINDIDNAADLSAIATYAYLKAKHEQGYPLTPNEANLLNEPFHTTPLSMLLNSRHDYVYVVYEKGFDTALNLEYHVKNAVRHAVVRSNGELELDMNYLLHDVLSRVPTMPITPQDIPVVHTNIEVLPDGRYILYTGINTENGTIVKCYSYHTISFDELLNHIPYIGEGIKRAAESADEKPDWDSIVAYNGLWYNLMYAYSRLTFGIDYEIVYRNNEYNLPTLLYDRIVEDVRNMLPVLKEKYYD